MRHTCAVSLKSQSADSLLKSLHKIFLFNLFYPYLLHVGVASYLEYLVIKQQRLPSQWLEPPLVMWSYVLRLLSRQGSSKHHHPHCHSSLSHHFLHHHECWTWYHHPHLMSLKMRSYLHQFLTRWSRGDGFRQVKRCAVQSNLNSDPVPLTKGQDFLVLNCIGALKWRNGDLMRPARLNRWLKLNHWCWL